ncbi:MAG: hypothetical protein EBS16_07075 [Betaproteobacteria bacterium]|nr:hypothetical protein [Betaproteobacteria bacterium]
MRVALLGRRSAQRAHHLCVLVGVGQGDAQARGLGPGVQARQVGVDHHAAVIKNVPALGLQVGIQVFGLREGRDAHHQGQLMFAIQALAGGELVTERLGAQGNGIDTAGPLGLARAVAHQPAVHPQLLGGRAGIDAGVFDAAL